MLILMRQGALFRIEAWAEDEQHCDTRDFLGELQRGGKREQQDFATLVQRRIGYVAEHGPIYNQEQSKELEDGIYEWKAPGGARLLWFYDETRRAVVVCTHGFRKPPSNRAYRPEIEKAKTIRSRYLASVSPPDEPKAKR